MGSNYNKTILPKCKDESDNSSSYTGLGPTTPANNLAGLY